MLLEHATQVEKPVSPSQENNKAGTKGWRRVYKYLLIWIYIYISLTEFKCARLKDSVLEGMDFGHVFQEELISESSVDILKETTLEGPLMSQNSYESVFKLTTHA